jgi:hypothetical protein
LGITKEVLASSQLIVVPPPPPPYRKPPSRLPDELHRRAQREYQRGDLEAQRIRASKFRVPACETIGVSASRVLLPGKRAKSQAVGGRRASAKKACPSAAEARSLGERKESACFCGKSTAPAPASGALLLRQKHCSCEARLAREPRRATRNSSRGACGRRWTGKQRAFSPKSSPANLLACII